MRGQSRAATRRAGSGPDARAARRTAVVTARPPGRAGRACARRPTDSPTSAPSFRTTRWQGMATASAFAAHAWATARTAFGAPMRRGDFGSSGRRAGRDLAQRLPDALLERRAADVEGQVEPERRRLDEADDAGHELLEAGVAADQPGLRKAVLEVAHQGVRVVAEQDRAHAPDAGGDQDRAQRALADGEADRRASPPDRKLGGGHAEHPGRGLVEAAARVEAGAVDRVRHGVAPRPARRAPGARGAPPRTPSASRR